jgi:hypothetical protein
MLVQVAPCDTRSRNPENPIQNKAMVSRTAAAAGTTLDYERLQAGPFRVAQQASDQDSFLKSHLESDITGEGYPLCQHDLSSS